MLKVGFAKEDISQAWKHQLKVIDEIAVKVCYMKNDDDDALMVVMDFQGLWSSTCSTLRKALAQEFDIPMAAISIFTTQNHSTPYDNGQCFDYDLITAATVSACKIAKEKLTEVEVAFLDAKPEKPLVFKRRKYFEGMGGFTYWFGYDQTPDGPAVKSLLEESFCGLLDGNATQVRCQPSGTSIKESLNEDDYQLLEADDPNIQGIFFRDTEHNPVGSLLRFGAHPATTNKQENDFTSADYPYYFRTAIEKEFGGEALFFTGPCGDQCPNIHSKSIELAKELGQQAADTLTKKFDQLKWEPCEKFKVASPSITLHLKEECHLTPEVLNQQRDLKVKAFDDLSASDTSSDEKLSVLKNLSDEIEVLNVIIGNRSSHDMGIPNLATNDDGLPFDLAQIEINNIIICGIPGEPFGEYANIIRDNVNGKKAFVIDEANGYLGYLPTEEEFGTGGYECNVALFSHHSEEAITAAFLE